MAPYLDTPPSPSTTLQTPCEPQNNIVDSLSTSAEPIAICGIALRLPGGIVTPDQFWDFLINKKDARGPVPQTRFNAASFYSKSGKQGRMKMQHGYFLDEPVDLGALDTTFFRMPRPEVERIDPQQRLLLELARECFDSAGEIDYRGKKIGTYVGSFGEDWVETMTKDEEVVGQYKITGYGDFVLSNRIAYEYDLKGPSMTIRTGCSAALIGLHEACLSIRSGECHAALVGGANLIMAPGLYVSMSDQGVLSPNGSCRTFDANADGYARAEAVNLVYIKKLSDALRDGNPIRAVIRGTAANADGKTPSLTLPNSHAHEAMIRRAYEVAGISDITETAFVECHGTGTAAGDPIETKTIGNLFGEAGVIIGGCKPNVGHSEGASGITSLIKGILSLEHRTIPPNIKFDKPNPKIPFAERKLTVPVDAMPWPQGRIERMSVNSFGIGGSNAHVVVESAAAFFGSASHPLIGGLSPSFSEASGPQLVVFSANTAESLKQEIANHQAYISEKPESLHNAAYTLGCRRNHLPHRAFSVLGDGIEANTSSLAKYQSSWPDLVLVFTGQGAQWPQMGAELLRTNSVFAQSITEMDRVLGSLPDPPEWTIQEEMLRGTDESRLQEAFLSQPVCTAVQVALVDALRAAGIRPFAVVGHSSGEMAAAYAAGRIRLDEVIIAAYYRGQASVLLTRPGAMAAVGMGWEETQMFLIPGVVIACENSPSSVTISGDRDKVEEMLESIREAKLGVFARLLKVEKAYHSHHVREASGDYLVKSAPYVKGIADVPPSAPLFFSSVTGKKLDSTKLTDAAYWGSNLESPVLFRTAVSNLVAYHKAQNLSSNLVFLEVGPHAALAGPLRQTLTQASLSCPYSSCLVRSKDASQTFLTALGQLWQQGVLTDFNQITNPHGTARIVTDLPTYAWHHDHSLMFESRVSREWKHRKFPKHELLGTRVRESNEDEPVYRNVLVLDHVAWVRDHNIKGDVIFPCAGYVGMAGEAARQLCQGEFAGFAMRNVVIDTAMVLSESVSTEIVTSLHRERLTDSLDSPWWEFSICSYNGSRWMKHCTGQVCPRTTAGKKQRGELEAHPRKVGAPKWYQALRNVGANYGPYFQGLSDVECATTEHQARGKALHTTSDDEMFYSIHPTKVDFFLQLFSVASCKGVGHHLDKMTVPTFITSLEIFNCDTELDMYAHATQTPRGLVCGGGEAYDSDGKLVFAMEGTKLSPLEAEPGADDIDPHAGARIFWKPDVDFLDMSSLIHPHPDQEMYLQLTQELTSLYIKEALRRLEGTESTIPTMQTFHAWMKKQPQPSSDVDAQSVATTLSKTAFAPFVGAMDKVLENIVPMFKGEIEALEVLMPNDTLTHLYNSLNLSDRGPFFQALGHSNPGMRILEIGAGTGGTTNELLQWLHNEEIGGFMYSNYTYTDISAGFFATAQQRFKDYPRMTFQSLDISKDPLEQGFEAGSYDLIIGANVLHATPSLKTTLSNVRKLLKPEGRLYMEELCCDVKPINFVMGVLPGWWLGAEDGRPDEPYVSPERWDEALCEAGFDGLGDVTLDCPQPNHLLAFMTAKPAIQSPPTNRIMLVHDEVSEGMAKTFQSVLASLSYETRLHDFATGVPPVDGDIIFLVDIERPFFEDISADAFTTFRDTCAKASEARAGIFWVTRSSQLNCTDPRWGQIIGAARCIRNELSIDFATCEINTLDSETSLTVAKVFSKFHRRCDEENVRPEYEYAIAEDGVVNIARLFPISVEAELEGQKQGQDDQDALDLEIGQYGRLSTLKWTPRKKGPLVGDEVTIKAEAVGLNFKDVLIAMGIVDSNISSLGLEASGIIRDVGPDVTHLKSGDRVLVFGGGCFSTEIVITAKLCVKIPDLLAFEDAATLPCVFSTVIHGLLDVGRLEKGQTVLIHSACGGVGLAAIQICRMVGAQIYCTVGNEEKVEYLQTSHGIPRECIFNSRDASFLADVKKATNGQGVDLVLNSLSGELLHASWQCVAEFGKMIEIGKRDLIGNGKLALNVFELNRSYHGVDLGHIIEVRPDIGQKLLQRIVQYYEEGHIKPLRPIKTFSSDAIEECFRYMQQGQHLGKIIVSMKARDDAILAAASTVIKPSFNPDASYLLVGGLGGLGRLVSNWMVENGAKHFVHLSRGAGDSEGDRDFSREIENQGCTITIVKGSVTELADVERAISAAPKPLRGILNMSMVLRDQGFTKMTHDEWTEAVLPKVTGTWNLHKVCVSQGIPLDFFLLFSSISGVMGQPGQANYAGANTFLDAFVQYRHNLGLAAAAVDIGAMLDHGYVAENPALLERLKSQGNYGIKVPQLLDALTAVLAVDGQAKSSTKAFVNPAQLVIGLRSLTPLADPSNRVVWKRDRRMVYYSNQDSATAATTGSGGTSDELAVFIRSATANPGVLQAADTPTFVARQIALQLFRLLLKPVDNEEEIDVGVSLQEAGLDSLVAVEMRSWWKGVFGFEISVLEMLGLGTVMALGERAVRGLRELMDDSEDKTA